MRWSQPLQDGSNQQSHNSHQQHHLMDRSEGSNVIQTPTIKNHSVTFHNHHLYCFGGYDGRRNHSSLLLFNLHTQSWSYPRNVAGTPPPGRNGHTATLAQDQIIILGGWLGSGPLAASDLFVLDVSEGPTHLRWYQPQIKGQPPGPCNMHSADYIPHLHAVFVFRGGNGREYLNDLHSLDCQTFEWRPIVSTGQRPQARANHSSALLQSTRELVIFGGWNGQERLNDVHLLDIDTSTWSKPHIRGELPMPRAGMTLSASRDRLYLFGGSGTSSKCFCDLQILDRTELKWLDVNAVSSSAANAAASSAVNNTTTVNGNEGGVADDDMMQMQSLNSVLPSNSHRGRSTNPLLLANPNDEDATSAITLLGRGPGRRAGHSATAVGRFIYIFGGSCGPDYLNDFFVLDTDPSPTPQITEPTSLQLLQSRMQKFVNEEEFSDVTFVLEGGAHCIYGHKMILCLVSDCFRAMFTTGFRESMQRVIEIPNCSYGAFHCMMQYIYTGRVPDFAVLRPTRTDGSNDDEHDPSPSTVNEENLNCTVEVLELADQFFLDHLKQCCERMLQAAI